MRKVVTFLACFLASASFLHADDNTAAVLRSKLAEAGPLRIVFSRVSVSPSGEVLSGSDGTLEIQFPCFYVTVDNFDIFGDDKVMWYRDKASDEIMVSDSELDKLLSFVSLPPDGKPAVLDYKFADGSQSKFKVLAVEKMASRWPESHFVLDDASLGENTVVTDLRK